MQDAYLIDKARVRASFDRAARTYDAAAILQAQVRQEMLARLALVKISPQVILDAGCGTGRGSLSLQKQFKSAQVISLDLAMGMLQHTYQQQPIIKRVFGKKQLICADIETLPLQSDSVDFIWSNLAIQWCNDLDIVFSEFNRVLKPNGLLMFTTFGPDTLHELRYASASEHTHISRFIDMHDIGDALTRLGMSTPVLDVEHYTLTYDHVKDIMRDLKAIGAHNATAGRARGLLGKTFLQKLTQGYESFRQQGKLPATYEVVYGHAWKSEKVRALPEGFSPITFQSRK